MQKKETFKQRSKNVFTEYHAGKPLTGIADYFWSFKMEPIGSKKTNIKFVPTHQTSVIIVLKNKKISSAFFHGPTLKIKTINLAEPVSIFAVSLTPFAAIRFFKLNFNDLLIRTINLKEKTGKQEYVLFKEMIEECANDKDIISVLSGFLLSRKKNSGFIDNDIENLCSMIINSHGVIKLEEFYDRFPGAKRQIQRKFKRIMTFTPKEFARLVRVQQAGTDLVRSGFKHFDVLYKYGYYDQSHYIKEFKSIMGSSPKDFEFFQKKIDYKYRDD